jgi:hypothetical protein
VRADADAVTAVATEVLAAEPAGPDTAAPSTVSPSTAALRKALGGAVLASAVGAAVDSVGQEPVSAARSSPHAGSGGGSDQPPAEPADAAEDAAGGSEALRSEAEEFHALQGMEGVRKEVSRGRQATASELSRILGISRQAMALQSLATKPEDRSARPSAREEVKSISSALSAALPEGGAESVLSEHDERKLLELLTQQIRGWAQRASSGKSATPAPFQLTRAASHGSAASSQASPPSRAAGDIARSPTEALLMLKRAPSNAHWA